MSLLRFTLFTLFLLLSSFASAATEQAPAATQSEESAPPPVRYDKAKDTLTVDAKALPLKEVLGYIAVQSSIEVMFDGRADRPVTAKFKDRPLEDALKNLLKESNYSLRYGDRKGGKAMLIGVKVLPTGEASGDAQPLLPMQGEAFRHELDRRHAPGDLAAQRNLAAERWKARLAELPPKLRQQVEKHAKERNDARDKHLAEREKRREEFKAKQEKRKADMAAERQSELDNASPEERALLEERRADAKRRAEQGGLE